MAGKTKTKNPEKKRKRKGKMLDLPVKAVKGGAAESIKGGATHKVVY